MKKTAYKLIYETEIFKHLKSIDKKHHSFLQKTIEKQLKYEPDVETTNRNPLTRPTIIGADWELRCGTGNKFRIFYRSDKELYEVYILAIGIKERDRLYIGGKEFQL